MKIKQLAAFALLALPFAGFAAFQSPTSGQEKADIDKLITDVRTVAGSSDVTQSEIQALRNAVNVIVSTANKPDPATVTAFISIVKSAKAAGSITQAEKAQIYKAGMAVLTSANVSVAEVKAVMACAKAIWSSTNVTPEDLQLIRSDVVTIVSDLPTRKKP